MEQIQTSKRGKGSRRQKALLEPEGIFLLPQGKGLDGGTIKMGQKGVGWATGKELR